MKGIYKFLNVGLVLKDTLNLEGTITVDKANLGIKEFNTHIKGKMRPSLGNIQLPIPLPFDVSLEVEFDNDFQFLDFPLKTDKEWGFPASNIIIKGQMGTGLNIFNFINKIMKLMGYELFPPEGHTLSIYAISDLCTVVNEEIVTVETGTYDAYNISLRGLINYFYAPQVDNIVKITANVQDFSTPYGGLSIIINGELIATNHE